MKKQLLLLLLFSWILFSMTAVNIFAQNRYSASGSFSEKELGWRLPDIETAVELHDLGEQSIIGSDEFGGLYKPSKISENTIGQGMIPYNTLEYLEHETMDVFEEVLAESYYNKVMVIELLDSFIFPSNIDWRHTLEGKDHLFESTEQDIKIKLEYFSEETADLATVRDKIGAVYAQNYGKLLNDYDRQAFYLYDDLYEGKAAMIAFIYGNKEKDTPFQLEIYGHEVSGKGFKVAVESNSSLQVISWYLLFLQLNKIGNATGY